MTGEFCLRGFLKRAALLILAVVVFAPIVSADEDQPNTPAQKFNFVNETNLRFAEIEIESGLPESADPEVLSRLKGKQEGKPAKFFSFTYGDEASRAVCMKYLPSQPSVLHVDVNRDQKFSDQEAFDSGETGLWFIDITAEHGQTQSQTSQQRIRIRWDDPSSKWHLATAGIRQGKVAFNGKLCDAKIEDKNANGLWSDPQDRLFVDFNGNGKISRLSERIPAQGMRKIRGKLYGIGSSASGDTVSLSEITGLGVLIPKLDLFSENAKVTSVSGSLAKYESLVKWIRQQVDAMPDSAGKVAAIMFAARQMPEGAKRSRLLKMAATAIEACKVSYYWDDPAKEILEELPKFDSITRKDFDELLFATIVNSPPEINSMQLNGVFADLVKMVAIRNPEIARKILDPAFENGAWLNGHPTWSAFDDNQLVKAYAWIDPKLAVNKATELSEQYSADDSVRKLQLFTTVIDELNSIAIRKGMLQGR